MSRLLFMLSSGTVDWSLVGEFARDIYREIELFLDADHSLDSLVETSKTFTDALSLSEEDDLSKASRTLTLIFQSAPFRELSGKIVKRSSFPLTISCILYHIAYFSLRSLSTRIVQQLPTTRIPDDNADTCPLDIRSNPQALITELDYVAESLTCSTPTRSDSKMTSTPPQLLTCLKEDHATETLTENIVKIIAHGYGLLSKTPTEKTGASPTTKDIDAFKDKITGVLSSKIQEYDHATQEEAYNYLIKHPEAFVALLKYHDSIHSQGESRTPVTPEKHIDSSSETIWFIVEILATLETLFGLLQKNLEIKEKDRKTFLSLLDNCLRYYTNDDLSQDPLFQNTLSCIRQYHDAFRIRSDEVIHQAEKPEQDPLKTPSSTPNTSPPSSIAIITPKTPAKPNPDSPPPTWRYFPHRKLFGCLLLVVAAVVGAVSGALSGSIAFSPLGIIGGIIGHKIALTGLSLILADVGVGLAAGAASVAIAGGIGYGFRALYHRVHEHFYPPKLTQDNAKVETETLFNKKLNALDPKKDQQTITYLTSLKPIALAALASPTWSWNPPIVLSSAPNTTSTAPNSNPTLKKILPSLRQELKDLHHRIHRPTTPSETATLSPPRPSRPKRQLAFGKGPANLMGKIGQFKQYETQSTQPNPSLPQLGGYTIAFR